MRKPLWISALLSVCWVWVPPAFAQQRLTVEQAVEVALSRNPDVRAAAVEVRAADAQIRDASLLLRSNPELSGGVGPRIGDDADTLTYEAELTQELEVFGERGARVHLAKAARAAVVAREKAQRSRVAAGVRRTFVSALAAEEIVASANDNAALARETLRAVERRVEVGDSARIELNTARVEVGRAARALARAKAARESALSELGLLLGMRPGIELSLQGDLRTPFELPPEKQRLVQTALQARSDRAAALGDVQVSRAEQTLAGRDWLPRPRVGVRYEHDEGDHSVLGTLSFQLPVFNRNQGARDLASARRSQADLAVAAAERRIEQEVLLAASRLSHAQEAAAAFEGQVVDALSENLKLGQAAYDAGKIGLFELLLIRRDALEARRGQIEALEELRGAETELARALGVE